jgi:hypothetical protein
VALKKPAKVSNCLRCGAAMPPGMRSHARYCTDLCGTLYRNKIWQAKNPEKMKAAIKRWRQANPERCKESHAAYRKRLGRGWYERQARWVRENRAKFYEMLARRYAAKRNGTPAWLTDADFEEMQGWYLLAGLKSANAGVKYHVDHIVPLRGKTVCGLHVPWNLQVLPATENIRKRNGFNG